MMYLFMKKIIAMTVNVTATMILVTGARRNGMTLISALLTPINKDTAIMIVRIGAVVLCNTVISLPRLHGTENYGK